MFATAHSHASSAARAKAIAELTGGYFGFYFFWPSGVDGRRRRV